MARADIRPTRFEAWLEERSPGYRFGYVLVLLLCTYIVMAAGPPDDWARVTTVALQWLTLMAALLAARVGRRLFRIAGIVGSIALVSAIASIVISDSTDPTGIYFALNVLLVGAAPIVIASSLYRRRTVDVHTVAGAVCIYVLLGMMFSFAYAAIDAIDGQRLLRADQPRDAAELPLLQLHHPDHRRVRRLHGGRQPRAGAGVARGARSASSTW